MRQKWTVTCSVYAESFSYKSITAYSITGQTGDTSIDSANRTLTLEMPDGTDLSSLVASFTVSTG
ncbi:MAG: hypothetical protein PHU31_09055, partial [Anaerotignum sp.]|nr:hypothetical protein [Anaerotignum sp.]